MNENSLLGDFCGGVQKRMGIGWDTILTTLLPVIIEMLNGCFNKPAELQAFAEGHRTPLQMAGLRIKCRRVAQENGVRGPLRIYVAGESLKEAILAELSDRAGKASGDVYAQAIAEAGSV